ncbi:MAG: class I SAM-dependent methyltransferase [Pseudomonadota bacterium]|nr:class I SAM-dependent methyltransferase [Pseudomonadota bacterium]
MTLSRLIIDNNLEQAASGLWHLPGADVQNDFAYSDGDDEEAYVKNIIANASDTSSTSAELESHIHDWPSEYHLTTKRAHLLRALDLSGLENVLELGCGCGAISRYLAEQGMSVDAIEGSLRRASIAYSRCRDLNNINIVNSNFNHLKLPEKAYDAVFLIGVLEYARRFCPDAADDRAAVLEIIAAIKKSLKPDGVIITAIENRLGLKYLMGATEDHYGVPYIGVHRYPESAGICTYDLSEWRNILDQAGFDSNSFLAPFPDYKIPTVVLHEDYLKQAEAPAHLRGSVSRDYLRAFSSDFDEYLFWQACNQNGSLLEFSNSYLIVAGCNNDTAEKIAAFDFAHFTGSQRKAEYRTATRKRHGEMVVSKQKLRIAEIEDAGQTGIQQICIEEDYLPGELLADVWRQSLMIWQNQQRLVVLYKKYFKFLQDYVAQNPSANDIVDILPFNIIVDEPGNYQSFDREWCLDESITPEFVLFRALFWFVYGNSLQFVAMFDKNGWNSIREYLLLSFEEVGVDVSDKLDSFAEIEDQFQTAIGVAEQESLIRSLLDTSPQARSGDTMFYPRLYWRQPDELFTEQNSISTTAILGSDRQLIRFDIPAALGPGSLIRFDPAERDGYFHLFRLKLLSRRGEVKEDKFLLELNSAKEIADKFTIKGASFCGSDVGAVFVAHDQDPHLEYRLPAKVAGLQMEVEMDWPHSEEYEIIRDGLRERHGEWYREKIVLQEQLDDLKFVRQAYERLSQIKKEMDQLVDELQADRSELHSIKTSRSYRITRKLAGILGR